MRAILIMEFDEERVMDECSSPLNQFKGTIEDAITKDVDYAISKGDLAAEDLNMVLLSDSVPPNDAELGMLIRNKLNE